MFIDTTYVINYLRDVAYRLACFADVSDISLICEMSDSEHAFKEFHAQHARYLRFLTPSYEFIQLAKLDCTKWTCGIVVLARSDEKKEGEHVLRGYSACDEVIRQLAAKIRTDSRTDYQFGQMSVHYCNVDTFNELNFSVSHRPIAGDGCVARVVTFHLYTTFCECSDEK